MVSLFLQIEVVTEACIRFLLQPDQLTPQQLAELYLQTCHLTSAESQQQALQLLVSMAWTQVVYDALLDVFKPLLWTQPELVKTLLLNGASGHMCGIQVGARSLQGSMECSQCAIVHMHACVAQACAVRFMRSQSTWSAVCCICRFVAKPHLVLLKIPLAISVLNQTWLASAPLEIVVKAWVNKWFEAGVDRSSTMLPLVAQALIG